MHSFKVAGHAGLAALAVLASPLALASESGWYGGLNAGRARTSIDDQRITSGLLGSGFATSAIVNDNSATGFKVFGGYQFNRHFALEGGYFDLGRFGYRATTVPTGSLDGTIRLKGLNLDTVGILPLTAKLSAFGRIGINYADARDRFSGSGAVNVLDTAPQKRDTNIKFGLGLQYAVTDVLDLRVEAERYRINDAIGNSGNVDLVSIGLVYRFGDKSSAPAPRVAEPVTKAGDCVGTRITPALIACLQPDRRVEVKVSGTR